MSDEKLPEKLHEDVLERLRAVAGWSDEVIEGHLAAWGKERMALLESLRGQRIAVDELGDLVWQSFPEREELERSDLLEKAKPARVGPRAVTLLGPDGKQTSRVALPADCQPGLILTPDRCLLHAPGIETAPFLALTPSWVDTGTQDFRTQHVDLHVHAEAGLVFACCREAGEVVVLSLSDRNELARWQIRRPGSWHAINVAFDADGERAYLSDNVSAQLWIADLDSLEYKVWKSGLGILGNLAPGMEPGKIFLSILAPQFSLIYFDLATMQASYSVEIKGKSWAQAKLLPCDPISLSPDGKWLHFMAWADIEGQRTSIVNVINAAEVISLRRFSLKEAQQTVQLAYSAENPFLAWHALDFKTWLLKKHLITTEKLEQPITEVAAAKPKPKIRGKFNIYQPPADDKDLWNKIDQPAEAMELPISAEAAIVDLLNWAFYRMTLTNLRIHPQEMKRLQSLAKSLRAELKDKQVVLAKLDGVLGKHAFETPIARSAVLSLLNQAKLGEGMVRLEDTCPICQQPFEDGECPDCGFRLAWPEGLGHPANKVSAEPATALYPGQLLLPHRKLNQLLTINIWRQPLQQLDLAPAGIVQLADAVVLPNHNYLVADSKGNKVVEISPTGEIVWKAKLALKHPARVSWHQSEKDLRYLIVDQGNARVLELDQSGRNWRRFPSVKTTDAEKLKAPCDVQLTPSGSWLISDPGIQAVLEIDVRSQVLRRWGTDQGVSAPLLARRMPDGATEILDAASGCWLEFLPDGSPGRKMAYWPSDHPAWKSAPAPDWACQLHNGEYLLMGEGYMLLFGPRSESVRWIHALPDPKQENALLKVGFRSKSEEDTRKQQLEETVAALKTIGCLEGEKDEHLEYLARFLHPLKAEVGAWLLQPESAGSHMYFVLSGSLDVIAPEPEKPLIYFADTGDVCGQFAMFMPDDKAYQPGIRVKEDCKLLSLERTDFKKAVVGFPRLYQMIRAQENDLARKFKIFAERKTEAVQDQLRHNINETRIREFGLFAGADNAFFDTLADKVQPHAYLPEQDVFGRLESAGSLYLIMQGQVGVLRKGETEPMIVLGEGEIFGEMALYFHTPRSATIRTLDYCKFFELEYRHIRALSARFPWFGLRLEEMATQRKQGNEIAQAAFEEAAGLHRQDLPTLEVAPAGQRLGQLVFYQASLHADMLVGFNTLGEVLWCWGREPEKQLFQPTRVHALEDALLVIDAGNDRVLQIDIASREITRKWVTGLNQPRAAALTPEGLLLAADEGNQRLVVMDESGREVWTHGVPEEILKPTWVEFTHEGHILFADAGMHRVYELQRDGTLIWKHGKWRNPGATPEQLDSPSCVRRLPDESTLIADAGNQRLVWIRAEADPIMIPLDGLNLVPDYCAMLDNGEFLVSSVQSDQIVRINRRGELIWRASLRFPPVAPQDHMPLAKPAGERWILDINRLDELEPEPPVAEAPAVAEPADTGPDAAELVLAWGEGGEEPADAPPPEAGPSAITRELDALLGDLHEVIADEHAAAQEPAAPAFDLHSDAHWADLLDDAHDHGSTLHLTPSLLSNAAPAAEPALAKPAPADVDDAIDMLFDDEFDAIFGDEAPRAAPVPSPEDDALASALDSLFDAEPSEAAFEQQTLPGEQREPQAVNPAEPTSAPAHAAPPETEDIASALDQLFDEPDSAFAPSWSDTAPATPQSWPGTQSFGGQMGPPTRIFNSEPTPTRVLPNDGFPTKMLPVEGHPTKMIVPAGHPTKAMESTPWADLERMMGGDSSEPVTAPLPQAEPVLPAETSPHWREDDFDWLDELQDSKSFQPSDSPFEDPSDSSEARLP